MDFLEKGKVTFSSLKFLVLDEADRMLDMGFLPEIKKIINHSSLPKERQTMMFSATFPTEVSIGYKLNFSLVKIGGLWISLTSNSWLLFLSHRSRSLPRSS